MFQARKNPKKKESDTDIKLTVCFTLSLFSFVIRWNPNCLLKPPEVVDLLGEDAMNNAYNICHNIQVGNLLTISTHHNITNYYHLGLTIGLHTTQQKIYMRKCQYKLHWQQQNIMTSNLTPPITTIPLAPTITEISQNEQQNVWAKLIKQTM